jgi:hypothetical protein
MGADLFVLCSNRIWQLWFLIMLVDMNGNSRCLWRNRTILLPMAIAVLNIILHRTMLVKITDDNAKEAQVQKH